MRTPDFPNARFTLVVLCLTVGVPSFSGQDRTKSDFAKESVVVEQSKLKVVFQNDGTYIAEQHVRARIQSDAGVRQYGLLPFSYLSSAGNVDVQDVRVTKPSGSVVTTPKDSVQDVTPEISRNAPMYSDLREKHLAVKGLEPGDTLEYSVRWSTDKPLIPGQFWTSFQFIKSSVVLDEQLEINVPREREIKVKSRTIQPTVREENGWRIYVWKTSNHESQSVEEQKRAQAYYAIRGMLPQPDVLISSFRSWEEVGRWYETLQHEKIQPSPEVITKAQELTRGLLDDDEKLRAIYNYVSLRYRYVGISFGIGRFQPHSAGEILGNQYGDCKDKHTLLAALLKAVGIQAYPALISNVTTVDLDVPSPSQFNHVISVVVKGGTLSWMDTTPEVAPIGYLVNTLRGKPALVIMPDNISFRATPGNQQFNSEDRDNVTAKLDVDGTLHAHVQGTDRGDSELAYRYVFRRLPESEWKEFARKNFYGAQLGGTIDIVRTSLPDKTDEPFSLTYDYTVKDFSGGDNHRFLVPLPSFNIPEINDEDLSRQTPIWLGQVGEAQYESHIEFPKGWSVTPPSPIDLKESFAEFQESSELKEGVLLTRRRLVLKANEVMPEQLKSYRAFRKEISERHDTYIFMHVAAEIPAGNVMMTPSQGNTRFAQLLREGLTELPGSSNSEALQAERDARNYERSKDYTSAITDLKRAVSLDPSFSRAWILLGATHDVTKDTSSALSDFQKAVDADPKQVLPYKILAFLYMGRGLQGDAIAIWQKLQSIAPEDRELWSNLSRLYIAQKRYADAMVLLESAAKVDPSDPHVQLSLGTARLRSHNTELGLEAMHKALEINSNAEMLNNVAYELAEADAHLSDALAYSQRSVKEVEDRSLTVDLEKLEKQDRLLPIKISAYWDTLGWIYFRMEDLARAESYLKAAWQLGQNGVVGDHLGQLYEKERKLPAALHMYNLALEANRHLEDTVARVRNLARVTLPDTQMRPAEELGVMRTIKLPAITKEHVHADFDVLMVAGKIEKVHFLGGGEVLRQTSESLKKASFEEPLPPNSMAHLLRTGALSCSETGCSFEFYPLSALARGD
jgi:tetratricopeptide (TPR) repeat protein/transglutaminase-like putative cysteine protease